MRGCSPGSSPFCSASRLEVPATAASTWPNSLAADAASSSSATGSASAAGRALFPSMVTEYLGSRGVPVSPGAGCRHKKWTFR